MFNTDIEPHRCTTATAGALLHLGAAVSVIDSAKRRCSSSSDGTYIMPRSSFKEQDYRNTRAAPPQGTTAVLVTPSPTLPTPSTGQAAPASAAKNGGEPTAVAPVDHSQV